MWVIFVYWRYSSCQRYLFLVNVHLGWPECIVFLISHSLKSFNTTDLYSERQHISGLKNLGNSCYINSVMQVLFTVPSFVDRFYIQGPQVLDSFQGTNPSEDFSIQMSKLAHGLLSGRWVHNFLSQVSRENLHIHVFSYFCIAFGIIHLYNVSTLQIFWSTWKWGCKPREWWPSTRCIPSHVSDIGGSRAFWILDQEAAGCHGILGACPQNDSLQLCRHSGPRNLLQIWGIVLQGRQNYHLSCCALVGKQKIIVCSSSWSHLH